MKHDGYLGPYEDKHSPEILLLCIIGAIAVVALALLVAVL